MPDVAVKSEDVAAFAVKSEDMPAFAVKSEEVPAFAVKMEAVAVKVEEKAAEAGCRELLYCGTTRFDLMGRSNNVRGGMQQGRGNLVYPTRLRPLMGVDIRFVASGCAACHCLALSTDGRCFTWGRNEKGQLGHGDTLLRNQPAVVSELSKYNIISASVGRNHTVIVTDDSKSFAFGDNKHGQLGTGSLKRSCWNIRCMASGSTHHVVGADDSCIGWRVSEYGHLGYGPTPKYNYLKC